MTFPYLIFCRCPQPRAKLLHRGVSLIILLALLSFCPLGPTAAEATPNPQVVILNSYHPGYMWSDEEVAGVLQELRLSYPQIDPAIEYLDTKRFPSADHLLQMKDYLARKYRGRKFDLVITLDNPALTMVLGHRPELFPGTPVVFAGINNFDPAMLAGQEKVTGDAEVTDIEGTLKLALSLHPETMKIFVVTDDTMTGKISREEIKAVLPRLPAGVQVDFAPPATMGELADQIKRLPDTAIVFISGFATDNAGQTFSMAEGAQRLTEDAMVPAYIVHKGRLGYGPVGGILLGGREEGQRAGEMALKILGGKDPSSIPVNTKSNARPMFDYRQLSRFKIPLDALPAGSIVINRPASFYEIHKFLVWGASGVVLFLGVVVLVLGVTINRRRRAEQELKHHFDFMQDLMDSIPNLVFYKDTHGVYLGCNKTLEAFLGLPKEEIVGKTVFDIYPKDLADKYYAMDQELFDHPGIQVYEFEMERPDGSRRKFIFNKATFSNTEGSLGGLIGVMTDITERKAAERALRESEEKFRLVFEKAPIGIMHYDQMSLITDCNEKFAEIIGAPKEKFIGFKLIRQLRDEKMRAAVAASLQGEAAYYEGDYLSVTGGKLTPVRAIFQPIFSPEGLLSGGVAIFEDITERKQAEVERLQFSKLESLSTLAGGIAHDFNNILTAILGNISLARLDQQEGQGLADAERACLRAKSLAHQLLTFAKGGAPIKELFSVAKLVTETGSFACGGSNVGCEFSLPDNLWTIYADSGQLGQVFQNLVINALQAMPAGGMIKIQGENLVVESGGDLPLNPGKYVKISIQDQGLGIPAESLHRIFDPYFTTKQTGSGLGLATACSIIKAHQGHIAVESTLGAGTVFQVYLPAAEEKISELPKGDQGVIRGAGKILVMDDEELVRQIIGKMLGHLGYEARFAEDGDEAVKLFTQAQQSGTAFDAVILDLTVPGGMGGKAALEKLLRLDPQVKAIVSSGYSEDAIMAEYAQHGFSGVIAKPYRIAELSVLLHKVIGKG